MEDEKVEMKVDISHKKEGKYIKQYHDRNLEQYSTPIIRTKNIVIAYYARTFLMTDIDL